MAAMIGYPQVHLGDLKNDIMPTDSRAVPRIKTARQVESQNLRLSSVVLLCHPWAYPRLLFIERTKLGLQQIRAA
jgi:hypothetical protein